MRLMTLDSKNRVDKSQVLPKRLTPDPALKESPGREVPVSWQWIV